VNLFGDRKRDAETAAAFENPQTGDRFQEMYSFWVYVVDRKGNYVTTMEASPPCSFPDDGKVNHYSLAGFRERFSYGSIPGYWVALAGRGHDVEGWLER
jgi:hypothetical protein